MIQLDEKRVVTKGNIPINDKLLNKYNSAEEIYEIKNRIEYNSWNYYVEGLIIENKEYILEFEVVSMSNGKNNYRVQRLELK